MKRLASLFLLCLFISGCVESEFEGPSENIDLDCERDCGFILNLPGGTATTYSKCVETCISEHIPSGMSTPSETDLKANESYCIENCGIGDSINLVNVIVTLESITRFNAPTGEVIVEGVFNVTNARDRELKYDQLNAQSAFNSMVIEGHSLNLGGGDFNEEFGNLDEGKTLREELSGFFNSFPSEGELEVKIMQWKYILKAKNGFSDLGNPYRTYIFEINAEDIYTCKESDEESSTCSIYESIYGKPIYPTPICGDGICIEQIEFKKCAEDCDWCGDGTCNSTEDDTSCPEDCVVCGDTICNGNENHLICPTDCTVWCGNDVCDKEETCSSCPDDCITNIALGKPVIGSSIISGEYVKRCGTGLPYTYEAYVDGNKGFIEWNICEPIPYVSQEESGLQWLEVDLGEEYPLSEIVTWHYVGYTYNNKLEISGNGTTWESIYDSESDGMHKETEEGFNLSLNGKKVRYIRDWLNGNDKNEGNHWVELEALVCINEE